MTFQEAFRRLAGPFLDVKLSIQSLYSRVFSTQAALHQSFFLFLSFLPSSTLKLFESM